MNEPILATYRLRGESAATVAKAAEKFAIGQSVGTWVPLPGLTPDLVKRYGAHVADFGSARDGADSYEAVVAFPADNFEIGFPMLWTTLLGNDPSTGIDGELVDISLPQDVMVAFRGPRLGIPGWRSRSGVGHRPLLLNAMKPSIGLTPDRTAAIAAAVARGRFDIVKDDEVLADTAFSSVGARVLAIRRALDEVAQATGRRTSYVVSITGRAALMARSAEIAVEAGADGVMVAAFAVGLDALHALVDQLDGRVPVIAHTAGIDVMGGRTGLGIAPDLLIRLCRLAGADAVLIGSPWARRATPLETWRTMADGLQNRWLGIPPAWPVVGGGIVASQLATIVDAIGNDVIITAGGAVNGHAQGPEAGALEMSNALESAVGASV